MAVKKTLIISKYGPPWLSTPLLEKVSENFKDETIFSNFEDKNKSLFSISYVFYLIKIQFIILRNILNIDRVLIYNDITLVISSFPLLFLLSFFYDLRCYFVFENVWFSKLGDWVLPITRFTLNSSLFTKIFVFDFILDNYLAKKGIDVKKSVTLSTGIDKKLFYPAKTKFNKTLLYVGYIDTKRNLSLMIESFRLAHKIDSELRLVIVGDGPDLINLKDLVKILHLQDLVEFTGAIPRSKVPEFVRKSGICLAPYPSELSELQVPFKIFEYMACGKPVITTETYAINKYFTNKKNALIVKFDKKEIADAMILLVKDRNLRENISHSGYILSKCFDWKDVLKKLNCEVFKVNGRKIKKNL